MTTDVEPGGCSKALLSWNGIRRGYRGALSAAAFVVPFGLAFGVAALEAGLSPALALLMSITVFAGASQFTALDLWSAPLPLVPILLATFAVNARHILLGATLYPWLSACRPGVRLGVVTVLSDVNWALAMNARRRGERDIGLLFGGGLALWSMWLLGTAAGLWLGADIGDMSRYGIDVVMPCFFAATLVGLWRGPADMAPWLAAAVVALVGSWTLPAGWHVLAGALAGGVVGVVRHGR